MTHHAHFILRMHLEHHKVIINIDISNLAINSWHAILTDLGNEFVKIWEDMHFWYEFVPLASPEGSLVALVDGFVHGFVYLFIFALLYNWLQRRKT